MTGSVLGSEDVQSGVASTLAAGAARWTAAPLLAHAAHRTRAPHSEAGSGRIAATRPEDPPPGTTSRPADMRRRTLAARPEGGSCRTSATRPGDGARWTSATRPEDPPRSAAAPPPEDASPSRGTPAPRPAETSCVTAMLRSAHGTWTRRTAAPQPAHETSSAAAVPQWSLHAPRHQVSHEVVNATLLAARGVNATLRGTLQSPDNVRCCRCRTDRGWNVGYGGNNGPSRVAGHGPSRVTGHGASRVAGHGPGRVAGHGPNPDPEADPGLDLGTRLRRNGSVVCGGDAR
jgi:hypothetical protein